MRMTRVLAIAAIAIILSVGAKPASAALWNVGQLSGDMATPYGFTFFATTLADGIIDSTTVGSLESNSMVTFTYSFGGSFGHTIEAGLLTASGEYGSGTGYGGASASSSGASILDASGLALVSADITNGIGTATITNLSAGLLEFTNDFFGLIKRDDALYVSYEVSSVPLPAALPMFGLALIALRRFFAKKKKKKSKEEALTTVVA